MQRNAGGPVWSSSWVWLTAVKASERAHDNVSGSRGLRSKLGVCATSRRGWDTCNVCRTVDCKTMVVDLT